MERTALSSGYEISRLINGGWQLAGGHGVIDRQQAVADLIAIREAGITTFDCADHYVGVEELFGEFRKKMQRRHVPIEGRIWANRTRIHTKCVPDLDMLSCVTKEYVEQIIDRSLLRLGVDRLDLVQFHWWDYEVPGYVEAMNWLAELQKAGKIVHLGTTNFDVSRLREIVASGVKVVSNQTQYSLLDRRPENGMVRFCEEQGIKLLCYGTVAGSFLSKRWLNMPEPHEPLENRSLTKYKLIIDDFGGWELFQELLNVLSLIADKYRVSITNVATRWVLDQPQVAAVIIGARNVVHLGDNLEVFRRSFAGSRFSLDDEDLRAIRHVVLKSAGPQGDTYSLERVKGGKHASIMRYNLNKVS